MTDKTQYCPLCEVAQREIVELKEQVRHYQTDDTAAMLSDHSLVLSATIRRLETSLGAANTEIAELDRRVRALDFVVDELKAERFTMIDEAIKIAHRGANNNLNGMEGADAAEFHDCETRYCCYTDIEHWLKEIRAKYEKGE